MWQISFHVRDFCSALSQLVHCPCCGCWTAFWTLLQPSLSGNSLMPICLFSFPPAFDHHFAVDHPNFKPHKRESGGECHKATRRHDLICLFFGGRHAVQHVDNFPPFCEVHCMANAVKEILLPSIG